MSPTNSPESPLQQAEHRVLELTHAVAHAADELLRLPDPSARSRWRRAGVGTRAERAFERVAAFVLLLFVGGWTWAIAEARAADSPEAEAAASVSGATAMITSSLTDVDAPAAKFLSEASVDAMVPRGLSGKLSAVFRLPGGEEAEETGSEHVDEREGPDTLVSAGAIAAVGGDTAQSGIYKAAVKVGDALRPLTDFSVINLKPASEKRSGKIGLYYLGNWPKGGGGRGNYTPPSGFIEVTPENQNTHVSEHFRIRDFITKNQWNVWPKYVVIRPRMLDKVELALEDLRTRHGVDPSGVKVLSGFRTPSYNAKGGDPRGRAKLSRHMYGDAADVYIDNDGNDSMDDLNRDGRVNIRDSQFFCEAVSRVEQKYPELIGGCGVYPGTGSHGPFVHIDTRGYRARWTGEGDSQ
jgi:uncharacterized protein YcbK (DUF882 family)